MRRVLGLVVALLGLILIGIVVFRAISGTFSNDLSNSILYASFGVLLIALSGWIVFGT